MSNRKIEFEKIKDEWILTIFQWFEGAYRPIDKKRGVNLDEVKKTIKGGIDEGRRITIWEE